MRHGRFLVLLTLWVSCASFAVQVFANDTFVVSGHTAAWYNPSRNGEGLLLEILSEDRALVYWFTYDEQGDQRWLTGVGEVRNDGAGDYLLFSKMWVTRGGQFGPDFDPDSVVRERAGEATLRFSSCDLGEWTWDAFGQVGSTQVQRLTQTMAAGCNSINGDPGYPVQDYAGQTGSWYDVDHDGEGFVLQWLNRSEALAFWFSYDTLGQQYWMYGVGSEDEGVITFPAMVSTRGARFGNSFDKDDVQVFDWGSLELSIDCTSGIATYSSIIASFGSGSQELTRLTRVARPKCPWVKPKLTDLYDFTWTEIPIDPDGPMASNNIQAEAIADDGTIVAKLRDAETTTILLWRPGAEDWEPLLGLNAAAGTGAHISRDGDRVLSNEEVDPDRVGFHPTFWRAEDGWKVIEGTSLDESLQTGASKDLGKVVGVGRTFGSPAVIPWVWDENGGQRELPETDEIVLARPLATSNDGLIIVGKASKVVDELSFPINIGILWQGEGEPEILKDSEGYEFGDAVVCAAHCDIVAGLAQIPYFEQHPNFLNQEAWYWGNDGRMGYLGSLNDVVLGGSGIAYVPNDITDDGTMIVGEYATTNSNGEIGSRGFIWTQITGIVSIREVLTSAGIGDDDWQLMASASVSSGGEKILLSGMHDSETLHRRAVVLNLIPKEGKTHGDTEKGSSS